MYVFVGGKLRFELIKGRTYEIGILKALGIRNRDLSVVLGLQIVLLLLLIIALYVVGSFSFTNLANEVLLSSIKELSKNSYIMDVQILSINLSHVASNCLLVTAVVFVAFAIPLIKLYRLKPTNVIKAKE